MESLSCSTWNVLADAYCNPKSFACDRAALMWNARSQKLLNVLHQCDSDIICLQEVDHYDFFQLVFNRRGYASCFVPRPHPKPDGLVIAWNTMRLELVSGPHTCLFDELADQKDSTARFLKQNVGACVILKSLADHCGVVMVANTHLYWNPQSPDIKLLQMVYFLRFLEDISNSWAVSQCTDELTAAATPAVLLMGDFNSLPTSEVYQLLSTGTAYLDVSNQKKSTSLTCVGPPKLLVDETLLQVSKHLRCLGVSILVSEIR
jgi:mRNA deadenylase 3'-5' endonuclease subunit Ccr4